MKAKEYAEKYNNAPNPETLTAICNDFIRECEGLIEARHAQTNSAVVAVFVEQDRKWTTFCNLVPGARREDFRMLAAQKFTEISRHLPWSNPAPLVEKVSIGDISKIKKRRTIPFLELLNRITGISIPIFGVSWNPPELDMEYARRLIIFLEDRRVLTRNGEVEAWANKSIIEIRERLTSDLEKLDEKSSLAKSLVEMRRACRKYLDTVQTLDLSVDVLSNGGLGSREEETFWTALNELRQVFGNHIAQIAIQFGIDIEFELASILPKTALVIPSSSERIKKHK